MTFFHRKGKEILKALGSYRDVEYRHSLPLFANRTKILDIACGTGTFLAHFPKVAVGLDINPDNVAYCTAKGYNAQTGSALELPFGDGVFDGVHCSHLMQVFQPNEAAKLVREICRVLSPGGIAVIATLNWFPRFFRHPENSRAYPPDVFWRYFAKADGCSSPMFPGMPAMTQEFLWLRRPPLFEFDSSTSKTLSGASDIVNMLQYKMGMRKYWAYNSYIIGLQKSSGQ